MNELSCDWLLTPHAEPLRQGQILMDKAEGRIQDVDQTQQDRPYADRGTVFLTPGLVNVHTHIELWMEKPIPIEPWETMADWIIKVAGHNRTMPEAVRKAACQKSIMEMIAAGTTCVNDITPTGMSLDFLSQVGMRGIVSPEYYYPFHHEEPDVSGFTEHFLRLRERFAQHPLLDVGISPHSTYNVTPKAVEASLRGMAPAIVHTHVAEIKEEVEWFQNGQSSLDRLHEVLLGQRFGPAQVGIKPLESFLPHVDSDWIIVHGVYLSPQEIAEMQARGASLAHCPRSNLWLSGNTVSGIKALREAGLVIGLGTDSRLSNHDLDLRAEARVMRERNAMTARETFEILTAGSAAAIKQGHRLGQLKPDYAADLVLWWTPNEAIDDPYEAWLAPETEPIMVMVNGRIVMEREMPC